MNLQITAMNINTKETLFELCNKEQNSLWVAEYIAKNIAFVPERQKGSYLKELVRYLKEQMPFIEFVEVFRNSKYIAKMIENEAFNKARIEHRKQQDMYASLLSKESYDYFANEQVKYFRSVRSS